MTLRSWTPCPHGGQLTLETIKTNNNVFSRGREAKNTSSEMLEMWGKFDRSGQLRG